MDTAAFETQAEWTTLRAAMEANSPRGGDRRHGDRSEPAQLSIWTSGRLCDFDSCEKSEHVKPVNVKGWFWSATNKKMSDTTCVRCYHQWSNKGKYGFPQPDNRELREVDIAGNESCLALLKAAYPGESGLHWHDKACYHSMEFVCEDSDSLLGYARRLPGGRRLR